MKELLRYSGADKLPRADASDKLTPGCLVCEGGAFRGVYSSGATDCLMEHDINLTDCIGVSAGALIGANYISGQIGRSAWFNLNYRHDPRYVGPKAFVRNYGIIGFDYMFNELNEIYPMNMERIFDPRRRLVVGATNLHSGKAEYFDIKPDMDLYAVIRASASMPFMSQPVYVGKEIYLDGGIADKIPFEWAIRENYEKIIVIKTRHARYRSGRLSGAMRELTNITYRHFPQFVDTLNDMGTNYNRQCDLLDELSEKGRVLTLTPSKPVEVTRVEKDMEKLGELYHLGYQDTLARIDEIKAYLNR